MSTLTESIAGSYTLDVAHTQIGFSARHAMVSKVRGAFSEFEGKATIAENAADSSVTVVIQAASIDTRNEQRDAHLRSDDFLSVETFPTLTFASTSVSQSGETFEITGDLTIKDVTKSITIPFEFQGQATDPYGNQRIGFEGSAVISRKDFGITWNAALEAGGVMVSDKVTLEFEVEAVKG